MDTNTAISLMLLICATPFIIVALVVLWLGPTRWPLPMRQAWETLPAQARTIAVRLQPVLWLLIGIFVGSALVHPVAVWLRALLS